MLFGFTLGRDFVKILNFKEFGEMFLYLDCKVSVSPLLHIFPSPPHHQFGNKPSVPVYPAGGTCTAPLPGEKCCRHQTAQGAGWLSGQEFELVMGSHLILQLILSVYLMLSNIKVVSGVVVDGLHKPVTDKIFR